MVHAEGRLALDVLLQKMLLTAAVESGKGVDPERLKLPELSYDSASMGDCRPEFPSEMPSAL